MFSQEQMTELDKLPYKKSNPSDIYGKDSSALLRVAAIGKGSMTNVAVNGVVQWKRLKWNKNIVLHPEFGIVCDGKLRYKLKPTDTWSADTQKAPVILNNVPRNIAKQLVENTNFDIDILATMIK